MLACSLFVGQYCRINLEPTPYFEQEEPRFRLICGNGSLEHETRSQLIGLTKTVQQIDDFLCIPVLDEKCVYLCVLNVSILNVVGNSSDEFLAKTGARPKIFLANLGTLAEFTPRASFAKNFFEAGGIEAPSGDGYVPADLATAFQIAATRTACICSSDKVYEKEAIAAVEALKAAGARHIYLAGRPGEHEAALRAAGVQTFIYDGCDTLSTLTAAYDILDAADRVTAKTGGP